MLPHTRRIRREADIQQILRSKNIARGNIFTIRVSERKEDGLTRFGVVTGRRVSKKAVFRNRVARWVREGIRPLLPRVKEGYDVLVIAYKPYTYYSFETCKEELSSLLKKLQILE